MSDTSAFEQEDRDARIGRIVSELYDRRARGKPYAEAEILAAHPDLADDLRRYLAVIGGLGAAGHDLDALIAQGVLTGSDDPAYCASLGAYRVIEFLGRGGMGIVLKAYEESLNRIVALKIIRPELAGDETALERFTREAKAAAALRDPNIVTVFAVGQQRGTHFLAMEYVDGPTLADVIRQTAEPEGLPSKSRETKSRGLQSARPSEPARAFSPGTTARTEVRGSSSQVDNERTRDDAESRVDDAGSRIPSRSSLSTDLIRDLFHQLLSGLAAAHDADLIHRDIKPANLLLDCSSRAGSCRAGGGSTGPTRPGSEQSSIVNLQSSILKIADFGLARMLTAQTRLTLDASALGTPEYMSPEQARGDEELDARSDLYSAGVVLYEMLAGRTPFSGGSPSTVIHRILHEDPPDPRTIRKDADANLSSLAIRLMAKRPEDRFASAGEVIEALEAGKRVRSLERRRRRLRGIAVCLAAIAILCICAWLLDLFAETPAETAPPTEPRVTDISVEKVNRRNTRTILARYKGDARWEEFYTFDEDANQVSDAVLVHMDGEGRPLVVAGTAAPVDGKCLFVFDAMGRELKGLDLSSDRHWPDCGPPTQWVCRDLAVADLDDERGDEVVVIAHDSIEYATRVSILDSRTWEIRSTFWHMGQLTTLRIEPDFFGKGKAALVLVGTNNKLDGFDVPHEGDDEPRTTCNLVSVMMILDPREMLEQVDGLGPPRTGQPEVADIPPARPYAYAFLNLPHGDRCRFVPFGATKLRPAMKHENGMIWEGIRAAPYDAEKETAPWFLIKLNRLGENEHDRWGGCEWTIDRYLEPRSIALVGTEPATTADGRYDAIAFWRDRWCVIIRESEYNDSPCPRTIAPAPPP